MKTRSVGEPPRRSPICIFADELIPRNEKNRNAADRRGVWRARAAASAIERSLAFAGSAC
jgi:hypothetical protein